jgi:putative ABC transport system permease protein|uniref:ABC transporter permease n=1 Tax=Desulfobacca acetoxidans TaxID=60893 RepID=A0A7C3YXH1_9BACT
MDLAVKDLKRHLGRFLTTIIGVGLLFGTVLAMNGIYRGVVFEGISLIESINPDLWVVERFRGGPFSEQSTMAEDFHYSVAAVPGVAQASPFIVYPVEREIRGKSTRFSIIGYDVFGGLGGPKKLTAGRGIKRAHYEAVAHKKLGLSLGEKIPLGLHQYTIVGLTDDITSPDGEPVVFLSLPDAQEVLFQRDNETVRNQRERLRRSLARNALNSQETDRLISELQTETHTINAVLVKLAPGADRLKVARHIEDWLYFSVYTSQEEINLMLRGRLAKARMQLLIFRIILLIVSMVILTLVIYTFTMEKIRSIAIMKLMGAANWVIVHLVLEQSLLLTVTSFIIGWLIIHYTQGFFPRKIFLTPLDEAITFTLALVGGLIASGLGIWQALKTQPALALGGH